MCRIALLFVTVSLLVSSPARGQSEAPDGRLNAFSCEKLPSPLKIDVQVLDNAPRYLRFRDKFVEQLVRDGISVMAGAALVLTLEVRTERELSDPTKGNIGEVRIGKSGGVSVRGKIWSNTGDSVLGGRKKSADRRAVDRLKVKANLDRRKDGRCLWQGEILHDLYGRDPDKAARRLAPILAGAIGQSVQNQPVEIPD